VEFCAQKKLTRLAESKEATNGQCWIWIAFASLALEALVRRKSVYKLKAVPEKKSCLFFILLSFCYDFGTCFDSKGPSWKALMDVPISRKGAKLAFLFQFFHNQPLTAW